MNQCTSIDRSALPGEQMHLLHKFHRGTLMLAEERIDSLPLSMGLRFHGGTILDDT